MHVKARKTIDNVSLSKNELREECMMENSKSFRKAMASTQNYLRVHAIAFDG